MVLHAESIVGYLFFCGVGIVSVLSFFCITTQCTLIHNCACLCHQETIPFEDSVSEETRVISSTFNAALTLFLTEKVSSLVLHLV